MTNLESKAARGGAATVASSVVVLAANLVALLVLSRMLDPWDFGIVAMVQAIISLGEILKNAGLSTAALQARELTEHQASNLFWLNTGLSALTAGAIAASTGLIVGLYHEPLLSRVVPLMALSLFMNGVGAQIRVQLARGMKFGTLAWSSATSQVLGVVVAILMAHLGFGFWALVGQTLAASATALMIESVSLRWIPTFFERRHGTRALLVTGVHYWLNDVLSFLQTNASTVVLGRALGAGPLGNYSRANQVASLPVGGILGPLMRVVLPILNAADQAGRRIGPIILKLQATVGAAFIGMLAAASGSSERLLPLVLGDGWHPASAVFAVLALGACCEILNYFCHWALMHYGRSRAILRFNLAARPLAVLGLVVGTQFGLTGAAAGFVLGQAVSWPLNFIWLAQLPSFPWVQLLRHGSYLGACGLATALGGRWASSLFAHQSFGLLLSLALSLMIYTLLILLVRTMRTEVIAGVQSIMSALRP